MMLRVVERRALFQRLPSPDKLPAHQAGDPCGLVCGDQHLGLVRLFRKLHAQCGIQRALRMIFMGQWRSKEREKRFLSGPPQLPQKLACSGFSEPQLKQRTRTYPQLKVSSRSNYHDTEIR